MTTRYVSTSGTDAGAGTSAGAAWRTLQYAVNNSSAGDEIRILPGGYARASISGKSGLTIIADSPSNRPYIRTNYHAILDAQDGNNNLNAAALYVVNSNNITLDGLRFDDERAPAITANYSTQCTGLTIRNCTLNDIWPSYRPVTVSGNTRSPVWIQASNGGRLTGFVWQDNEITNSNPRSTDGRGTEILTITGEVVGILIDGGYWYKNQAINLNMLGNKILAGASNMPSQPRRIVVRNCIFEEGYLLRDGQPATTANAYCDRGTGPILYENCIFLNPKTQSAGVKLNWEPGDWGKGLPYPVRWAIVRNCIMVCQRWPVQVGQDENVAATYFRPVESAVFAHNVMITTDGAPDGAPMMTRHVYNLQLLNNVLANFGTGSADRLIQSKTAERKYSSTWRARGNVLYGKKANLQADWGPDNYTLGEFVRQVQANTGSIGQPSFVHGRTSFPQNGDYTGYSLEDWALAADSPGYKDAEPLTLANGAGSSATTLIVDDALSFFSGVSEVGVGGDVILVGGVEATVADVDYENNRITLISPISWSDNAEIRYKPLTAGVHSAGIVAANAPDVTPSPPPPDLEESGQKLVNGDFSEATGWMFAPDNGAGELLIDGSAAIVRMSVAGTYAQIYQAGLTVANGESLRVVFWSQSNNGQTLTAQLIDHVSGANLGLNQAVQLSATCQAFTIDFTTNAANTQARFRFFVGGEGTVTIHGVYMGVAGGETGGCPGVSASGATEEQTLSAQADAVISDGGFYDAGGTNVSVGEYSDKYYSAGFHFETVTAITQSATVLKAMLTFYSAFPRSGATACPPLLVRAAAETMPATWAAWDGYTLTTAHGDYTPTSWDLNEKHLVDVTAVLQEIVDAQALAIGDDLFVQLSSEMKVGGGKNTQHYLRATEYGAGELAATLKIVIGSLPLDEDAIFEHTFTGTFEKTWS